MADGDPSPFGTGTSTAAAVAPVVEAPMTNPQAVVDMGMGFRAKHLSDFDARTKEVDNVFSKQQLNVDTMSKLLDDTTASLKRSREGRSNLPLMALGAGMMSSPGDFGAQLGAGVKQMVPAIQQQRGEEDDYQYKLAQLAMKRAGVENAPLQDKLAYLRALQVGDEASARAIEVAMLKAQGQTDKDGGKDARAGAALEEKAHKDAMAAAQNQVKMIGEGTYTTPEQRMAAFLDAYEKAARGFKLPEAKIKEFVEAQRKNFAERPKGGIQVPGDKPEDIEAAQKIGLPPKPVGYIYDKLTSPADAKSTYEKELANYHKETKDQAPNMDKYMAELNNIERAMGIIEKYPGITGPTGMVFRNTGIPTAARDNLKTIFASNQIHSVPQGQGAISDYERTLFQHAGPNMDNLGDANRDILTVRKQILLDQLDKQKFINTYFGHYKTTEGALDLWRDYARSNEGRAGFIDDNGRVVANPARISWQQWMAKQHGTPAQTHAEGGQHKAGGAVHLGSEWG